MKTTSVTKITLAAMVAVSITFTACQKEKIAPKAPVNTHLNSVVSKNAARDLSLANVVLAETQNAMFLTKNKSSKGTEKNLINNSACATFTYDTIIKPYVETINYGTGCVGTDGNTRSGSVSITYNNSDFHVAATTATISYSSLTFNGQPVAGTETVVNNGTNTNGNLTFSIAANFQIADTGLNPGPSDSVAINYLYEWVQGQTSNPLANLQFSVTGGGTSNFSNGASSTLTITAPLLRNFVTPGCNYYVQGTETIQPSSGPTQTIDYGNGTCTGMETVTVNGQSTTQPQ